MGSTPGAARLLPVHAVRAHVPAGEGGVRDTGSARGGWIFPAAVAAAAERVAVLHGRRALASVCAGCDTAGAAGVNSAVAGRFGPGEEFHAGIYLYGSEGNTLDGVIVVDKPEGWTSHDVVGKMRRIAKTKRWDTSARWIRLPRGCCR